LPSSTTYPQRIRPQWFYPRWFHPAVAAAAALFTLSIVVSIALSYRWGINQDTPLIHYVVFLMAHGFAPYRDIVEMNMPGSYMTEWAVIHLLGPGDAAWRIYDVLLMAIAALAGWSILRPTGRWAAFFGAALLTLYHLDQGPSNVGQRDYALAILLLAAYAFLFHILRPSSRAGAPSALATLLSAASFAACLGWAAAIKPTVIPFAFLLLIIAVVLLRRERRPIAPFLFGSLLGALVPTAAVAAFLLHYHAVPAFLDILRNLAAYHRGNGNIAFTTLLLRWLPRTFIPAAILAVALLILQRRALRWPQLLLLLGFVFGVATYIYQGKGWTYHAAPAMMFLLLLATLLAFSSARPAIPVLLLVLGACIPAAYTPIQIWRHSRIPNRILQDSLAASLNSLGEPGLSGHIQCLDWNAGCIDILYRDQLVQSTGFIYDFYLFPAHPAPVTDELQQRFLSIVEKNPPRVIVLTSHDWPAMQDFAKLERWPAFEQWLNSHYALSVERRPTDRAYRIYVLR
jgi:hypothetical protein